MRPEKLTSEQKLAAARELPAWSIDGKSIVKEFEFESFGEAMGFMNSMAEVSEELDHHPTWTNTYNKVRVELTTHDVGGLSPLDLQWARRANELVAE